MRVATASLLQFPQRDQNTSLLSPIYKYMFRENPKANAPATHADDPPLPRLLPSAIEDAIRRQIAAWGKLERELAVQTGSNVPQHCEKRYLGKI
jgi:hypothetical protein